MAATITWDGTNGASSDGIIDTADSATGWTAVKITAGGQAPTAVLSGNPYEGSDSITCRSDNKRVYMYFDIGAGNTLDFTASGNAEDEMIYIWINFLGAGDLLTQANGGLGIFLESSTPSSSQYHLYYFYGSDNYNGGWRRLVLDPTKTVSASAGTGIDLTAVRYIGVFSETNVTAKFDNLLVDQMSVGKGLIVTGTSTTDALIADLIADENTNRRGIVIPLNDPQNAVELNGSLTLGDVTAATNSTLTDVDSKIFLAEPKYYQGSEINSVPDAYFSINCVGGTGTNAITIGKVVGSDSGRNGWSVVGNSSYDLNIDFDNDSVDTSEWYGCSFSDITGTLSWGTDNTHECFSNTFTGCSQFDPVGAIVIRNTLFVATSDVDSALLWNENIDIADCSFIANTVGAGIEHPSDAGDPYDHDNLQFNGNTNDVLNSAGAAIDINKVNGSNGATSEGSAVTFLGSVNVTVTVLDPALAPIEGAIVYLKTTTGEVVVLNGATNASGVVTGSFSGSTPVDIDSTVSGVKHGSSNVAYKYFVLGGEITSDGFSATAILSID